MTLEAYHAFINWYVLVWYESLLKALDNVGEKWTDIEETIMPWLVMRNLVFVVVEVYKIQNQFKPGT